MRIRVSPSEGKPIYLQILEQVKYQIAAGRLCPGDELPGVRSLAQQLLINPNTVARAYRELEQAGLVYKRQGSGTFVSDKGSPLAQEERVRLLTERVDALVAEARNMAFDEDAVSELVRDRFRKLRINHGEEQA